MLDKIIMIICACTLCFAGGMIMATPTEQPTQKIEYNYHNPTATMGGKEINGFFDPTSGILSVYTYDKTEEQAEHIILHEFGHYLYNDRTGDSFGNKASEIYAENYAVSHKICGVN